MAFGRSREGKEVKWNPISVDFNKDKMVLPPQRKEPNAMSLLPCERLVSLEWYLLERSGLVTRAGSLVMLGKPWWREVHIITRARNWNYWVRVRTVAGATPQKLEIQRLGLANRSWKLHKQTAAANAGKPHLKQNPATTATSLMSSPGIIGIAEDKGLLACKGRSYLLPDYCRPLWWIVTWNLDTVDPFWERIRLEFTWAHLNVWFCGSENTAPGSNFYIYHSLISIRDKYLMFYQKKKKMISSRSRNL